MKSCESHQLECYSLECPVSCSVLPLYQSKSIEQNSQKNINQQGPLLEVTLWDSKHKIQNFTFINNCQQNHNQTSLKTSLIKIGDTKNHKFAIEKAYKFGAYTIILDSDKVLTVRQECGVQEHFTNIYDIAYYGTKGIQMIGRNCQSDERNKDNKQKGKQRLNECNISSIFILKRVNQKNNKLCVEQLVILILRRNTENSEQSQGKNNNMVFKVIQLNPKHFLQAQIMDLVHHNDPNYELSPNGRWALSENFVYQINVQQLTRVTQSPDEKITTIQFDDQFRTQIKIIDMKVLSQRLKQNIYKILMLEENPTTNLWTIVYLNQQGTISSGQFFIGNNLEDIKVTTVHSLIEPKSLSKNSSSQTITHKVVFFNHNSYHYGDNSPLLMFILQKSSFFIYEVSSLKFICTIDISQVITHQLGLNSHFVLNQGNETWVFDESKLTLHRFNLKGIIRQFWTDPLNRLFQSQSEQWINGHVSTVKLLSLRLKIVKLLSAYLENKIQLSSEKTNHETLRKNPDYSSCLRLLSKEENISILNDGVTYLIKFVVKNNPTADILQTKLNASLKIKDFQEALIKLVNKLVLSKYQSHVENGLDLLIQLFSYFSCHYQHKEYPCKVQYIKIVESSRVKKLLLQEKKKRMWELAYMFSLKLQNTHLDLS